MRKDENKELKLNIFHKITIYRCNVSKYEKVQGVLISEIQCMRSEIIYGPQQFENLCISSKLLPVTTISWRKLDTSLCGSADKSQLIIQFKNKG